MGLMRHGAKVRPAQVAAMDRAAGYDATRIAVTSEDAGSAAAGTGVVTAAGAAAPAHTLPEEARPDAADALLAYYTFRLPPAGHSAGHSRRDGAAAQSVASSGRGMPPLLPLPYVYTAPDADALVKADDVVFVVASVHNTVIAAATVVQRWMRTLSVRHSGTGRRVSGGAAGSGGIASRAMQPHAAPPSAQA
jgi:hypothetical protein